MMMCYVIKILHGNIINIFFCFIWYFELITHPFQLYPLLIFFQPGSEIRLWNSQGMFFFINQVISKTVNKKNLIIICVLQIVFKGCSLDDISTALPHNSASDTWLIHWIGILKILQSWLHNHGCTAPLTTNANNCWVLKLVMPIILILVLHIYVFLANCHNSKCSCVQCPSLWRALVTEQVASSSPGSVG